MLTQIRKSMARPMEAGEIWEVHFCEGDIGSAYQTDSEDFTTRWQVLLDAFGIKPKTFVRQCKRRGGGCLAVVHEDGIVLCEV